MFLRRFAASKMCLKAFFRIFPKRYFLAILSFIVVLLQISMRTIFTMSLVYLNSTAAEQNGTNLTDVAQNSTSNERIYWSTLIYLSASHSRVFLRLRCDTDSRRFAQPTISCVQSVRLLVFRIFSAISNHTIRHP